MKWNAVTVEPDGYIIRSGFLLFPKCIDGEWRWLEHAKWETYRNWNYYVDGYFYTDTKWIDK